MALQKKRLRNLADNLKDKASVIAATLSIKRHVSSINIHILRATTHALSSPPSESRIAAILSVGNGSHILPRTCINALMDRLHHTKSATVAFKCLFTLHNIIVKGPFTLKDQLSCYPSYGGHNFLNLSTFRDDKDFESVELSSWVRWYASVLENILTVSRVLGYYLGSSNSKDVKVLGISNADLLYRMECLVVYVEKISDVPESLHLQKNELVYEVVRLIGEDYRSVQGEILLRLEELGNRIMENVIVDVGELNELLGYLKRLEESRENLVLLFVNRKKNNGFWDLIRKIKMRGMDKKEEIEGKWLTVVANNVVVAAELNRSTTNPFLEPGQLCPVLPFSFTTLWFALVIASNSSAWLTTAVLVTNMRNFPVSRGKVAGILKGYGGLSAAVFTEIYSLLLQNSSSKFLLLLTIGIPIVCFSMMFLVRPCTPALDEDSTANSHFIFIQCSSVVLGLYLLATTIFGNILTLSGTVSYVLIAVMVILLMAPIAVPIKMTLYPKRASNSDSPEQRLGSSDSLSQGNDDKRKPLLGSSSSTGALGSMDDDSSEVAMLLALGEGAIKQKKRRPKRGEDFKFTEAVVKADFWLLFFVYFVGVGTGVTVLNNLAQIGIAQGEEDTTTLLSIFSFCNFVGRLGGGVVSEHFVRTKTIPRTAWLTCTQTIMLMVYLLFAFAIDGALYPAVAFLGVCYGVQVSIMIPTVSEVFGLKHFGVLSNFMAVGNPLGALLFSALLAGSVYDHEAAKQHGGAIDVFASGAACIGANCFKLTFFILSGVCAAGIVLSLILTSRIKPVYQMLYAGGSFRLPQKSLGP